MKILITQDCEIYLSDCYRDSKHILSTFVTGQEVDILPVDAQQMIDLGWALPEKATQPAATGRKKGRK